MKINNGLQKSTKSVRKFYNKAELFLAKRSIQLISLFVFIAALFFLAAGEPIISGGEVIDHRGIKHELEIPMLFQTDENVQSTYHINIRNSIFLTRYIRIIPDDKVLGLTVNGEDVPLDHIPEKKLSDYRKGFALPIKDHLKFGDNELTFKITNTVGPTALNIRADRNKFPDNLPPVLIFASLIILSYPVLRKLKFNKGLSLILLGGIAIRIVYLFLTPPETRTYDVKGHLDYIEYIMNNLKLPDKSEGWLFYHPPVYYMVSAPFYKIAQILTEQTVSSLIPLKVLQTMTFLFNMIFTISMVKILEYTAAVFNFKAETVDTHATCATTSGVPGQVIHRRDIAPLLIHIGAALLVFWPSNIIHSARIGNDALMYPLYGLGLYFLVKWNHTEKKRHIILSVLFSCLAVLTKTNAVGLMAITGIVIPIKLFKNIRQKTQVIRYVTQGLLILMFFTTSLGMACSSNIISVFKKESKNIVVGNSVNLDPKLSVGNDLENFLYFDVKSFLTEPFTSTWSDGYGRQYFSNFMLKSSLFGEFTSYDKSVLHNIGVLLSYLLFVMVLYTLPSFFLLAKEHYAQLSIILLNFLFFTAALMGLRYTVPYGCSNDFRYILPVLVSWVMFFILSIRLYEDRNFERIATFGKTAAILFCALSVYFMTQL